jgi:hypothetical protein
MREQQRFAAAVAAIQGLCANFQWCQHRAGCLAEGETIAEAVAESALECADALLAALYPDDKESLTAPITPNIFGTVLRAGDNAEGIPTIEIETTRERLRRFPFNPVGSLAVAQLSRTKTNPPTSDPDGWIPHVPGDAMPCDPIKQIEIKTSTGLIRRGRAGQWSLFPSWWAENPYTDHEIIAWKPA